MPTVSLNELEDAVTMVDDGAGETRALVSRETGMIHLLNDEYMDEEAPLPADIDDEHRYVVVPAARDLDLGHDLVFRFADRHMPGDVHQVRELFRSKGAYGRFSRLLEQRGATDQWHRFRDEETQAALRRWCEEHGLKAGA